MKVGFIGLGRMGSGMARRILSGGHELVVYDVARQAIALSGQPNRIKVAFGTEGGLFQDALSTTAVVCGPGSMDQGHKPDEFVSLEQMEACRAMLARLTDRLAA